MPTETDTAGSLKGHKLLVIAPWAAPAGSLEKFTTAFPDLEVVVHVQSWDQKPPIPVPAETWKDVTILLTFAAFPTPEQAPKLAYVQLMSAGANHVLEEPIFKDTEVPFCTANGVHGWVSLLQAEQTRLEIRANARIRLPKTSNIRVDHRHLSRV